MQSGCLRYNPAWGKGFPPSTHHAVGVEVRQPRHDLAEVVLRHGLRHVVRARQLVLPHQRATAGVLHHHQHLVEVGVVGGGVRECRGGGSGGQRGLPSAARLLGRTPSPSAPGGVEQGHEMIVQKMWVGEECGRVAGAYSITISTWCGGRG